MSAINLVGVNEGPLNDAFSSSASRTEVALVAFIEEQHGRLVRLMSLYVGDRDLADDLAQEALARVCRDWSRVKELDAPDVWVRRVAFNLANSHFRRTRTRDRVMGRLKASARAGGAHEGDENRDRLTAMAVRRAVASLPPPQRTALVLRYFEDLPVSQAAVIMGVPEGTVKSHTSRAIAALRASGLVEFEVTDD